MKFISKPRATLISMLVLSSGSAFAMSPLPKTLSEVELGEVLYSDSDLSSTRVSSCESCHALSLPGLLNNEGKSPSFVDDFAMAVDFPVSLGASVFYSPGTLNAPSIGYAAFTPEFHENDKYEYVGGQFWNGRASSLADQAEGPFLNPVELEMPSKWALVTRLKEKPEYVASFKSLYDIDLDKIQGKEGAKPSLKAPDGVEKAYNAVALAIAEFEKTDLFNRFTSKYDFYLAGKASLTKAEKRGLDLFNGKGNCSSCHTSEASKGKYPLPPLFTNYKYYNLGVARNHHIPNNPEPDIGLAGNPTVIKDGKASESIGKHKVMSLRNVSNTRPYMHNGIFKTLKEVVHFHNTRDVKSQHGKNSWVGFGSWFWPEPEYSENLTYEIGNLGLTDHEENDIVKFLETLDDGYKWKKESPWTANAEPAIKELHANGVK